MNKQEMKEDLDELIEFNQFEPQMLNRFSVEVFSNGKLLFPRYFVKSCDGIKYDGNYFHWIEIEFYKSKEVIKGLIELLNNHKYSNNFIKLKYFDVVGEVTSTTKIKFEELSIDLGSHEILVDGENEEISFCTLKIKPICCEIIE